MVSYHKIKMRFQECIPMNALFPNLTCTKLKVHIIIWNIHSKNIQNLNIIWTKFKKKLWCKKKCLLLILYNGMQY